MKFLFLLLLVNSLAFATTVKWNTLELKIPDAWKAKKVPMPSVSGYFLTSKINNIERRFFVNTHKPDSFATKLGGDRYFKEYLNGFNYKGKFDCVRDIKKMSYSCHTFVKKNNKWSLKFMYWYQDKERLLVNLDNIESLGEARSIYSKLKVGVP